MQSDNCIWSLCYRKCFQGVNRTWHRATLGPLESANADYQKLPKTLLIYRCFSFQFRFYCVSCTLLWHHFTRGRQMILSFFRSLLSSLMFPVYLLAKRIRIWDFFCPMLFFKNAWNGKMDDFYNVRIRAMTFILEGTLKMILVAVGNGLIFKNLLSYI